MSSLRQCLIIDPMHISIFTMLKEIGWEGVDVSVKDIASIKPLINQYEGLFVRTRTRVDEQLLGNKPTIKFVGRAGAGLDNIDQEFLLKHNIKVLHASEGNRDAVGEYAVGALLSLLRNIPRADAEVRQSIWLREENRGEELMGKTVGIIGYGNMGKAFAKRLSGFGCKVIAYDKYKQSISDEWSHEASLENIFEETDILSLHIPLTHETREMLSMEFITRFKKPFILINTARGEIVKLNTLASGIETGIIRGAALDVLENEKLTSLTSEQQKAFTFLTHRKNVIFTPHIAGWTNESHYKINQILVQKLQALGF
ncbi:phosphoglycerate dehydrogenase [Chryseotalea sanaruensis]|uniref:Phosphoglycerate dehydrogenase n=1 Tax=Chryseotalea sanaruensis TaxID=2482724 RepID=A0A401UEN0_9BACT|nr:NAD(P)-dependent oxidoreductase [Chryseotalea sanaruensis]GCC53359.1 phosphoglycerate dehydrogenase [Chryseotalea sanaruensis]